MCARGDGQELDVIPHCHARDALPNGVCLRFTDGVLGQLFSIVTEIILLGLVAAALLWYDPRLVLLALAVFLPLTLVYALVFRRRMNENGRTENRLFVAQNKTLYETLRGYSDIEINNAERYVSDRFRDGLRNLTDCRRRAMRTGRVSRARGALRSSRM